MKKVIFLSVLLFLLSSCTPKVLDAPPLQYSFMPKYMDLDSIGPTIPTQEAILDTSLEDFKSIPIDPGTWTDGTDTFEVPGGVLISDKKAAEFIYLRSTTERQEVMLKYSKYLNEEYFKKSLEAEKLYQEQIVFLKKKAERSWLERNSAYIGFFAGILTAICTEIAVIKVVK